MLEMDSSTQLQSVTSKFKAADPVFIISLAEVVRGLKMTKTNTAPGLGYACGRIFLTRGVSASVLSTMSLQYGNIPQCSPFTLKDTTKAPRAVALTSLVMKAEEHEECSH